MEVTGRDREFDRLRATGRAEKKRKKKGKSWTKGELPREMIYPTFTHPTHQRMSKKALTATTDTAGYIYTRDIYSGVILLLLLLDHVLSCFLPAGNNVFAMCRYTYTYI